MTSRHVEGPRKHASHETGALLEQKSTQPPAFNEHLAFFDRDENGKISPKETVGGLERLGFGYLVTVPGAAAIHAGVAVLGHLQAKPVSARELELPKTGTVRHPDTRLIDEQGNFDEARLDALFREHGKHFAGEALTVSEIARMLGATLVSCAQRSLQDALLMPTGIVAVAVEWGALLWVAGQQRDGVPVLEKSAVHAFYTDPHFFEQVAERLAKLRAERARTSLGRARNFVQRWLA
jgi:peroxygenase